MYWFFSSLSVISTFIGAFLLTIVPPSPFLRICIGICIFASFWYIFDMYFCPMSLCTIAFLMCHVSLSRFPPPSNLPRLIVQYVVLRGGIEERFPFPVFFLLRDNILVRIAFLVRQTLDHIVSNTFLSRLQVWCTLDGASPFLSPTSNNNNIKKTKMI